MARKASRKANARTPAKRKSGGQTGYQKRLREYQRTHPNWRNDPNWKQRARGHKLKEHVGRKEREAARIEAFAEQQAARFKGADPDELAEAIRAQVAEHGMRWLQRIERWVRERHAEYVANKHQAIGINIDDMADVYDVPATIFGYH